MPSASEVTICNQAIGWVGGNRIISLDDGTTEANICKDNYDELKKAVLEDVDWTFAIKRLIPSPEASAPAFGYSYSFLMPAECLRIVSVSDTPDYKDENDLEWQYENRRVLCDTNVIYIKYIKNIDDVSLFSTLFRQALSARIAADIAIPIAQSRTLQADMWKLYAEKLRIANNRDALQGKQRNKKIVSSWLSRGRNR